MLAHGPVPPNILIVIADQQRHDAVGYSNPDYHTPQLDRLAREALVCTRAYTQSPQCQPARCSLLTGLYPTVHRVWWNSCRLSGRHPLLPELLPGYHTAWFGKLDLP